MLTIALTIGQGMRVTQGHLSMSTHMSGEWEKERGEEKKNGKRPFRVWAVELSKDEWKKKKESTKGMDNYLIYICGYWFFFTYMHVDVCRSVGSWYPHMKEKRNQERGFFLLLLLGRTIENVLNILICRNFMTQYLLRSLSLSDHHLSTKKKHRKWIFIIFISILQAFYDFVFALGLLKRTHSDLHINWNPFLFHSFFFPFVFLLFFIIEKGNWQLDGLCCIKCFLSWKSVYDAETHIKLNYSLSGWWDSSVELEISIKCWCNWSQPNCICLYVRS